jgi:serine/threonine protein kinase
MAHSPEPSPLDRDVTGTPTGRARVGGYVIERPIASGASGTVYRALDERLGRRVALKVLSESGLPQARERFLREVRAIAGLQHPNVVHIVGAGEDRGVAWAAMELMPASLSQELHQRGRFSAGDLRAIIRDVCLGLDAAWRRGIVHRDIKPSNLLRGADGTVKVAGFGLAKDLSLELNLAARDAVHGTPWYLSPEEAAGTTSGVTSDLYSLGATLYHLAAGRPPFDSANVLDVIVRHAIEPVPPLPDDVPPSMTRLTMSLLEKDPSRRPGDYQAVLAALDDSDQVDGDPDSTGALTRTLLAAARAALQLGRGRRVRSLLEPIVSAHDEGWTPAGFLLATALEDSQAVQEAREILDDILTHAASGEDRALALWNLGRLAEKEGAFERAVEIYSRIKSTSTPRFPLALLDARIARLRNRTVTPPA